MAMSLLARLDEHAARRPHSIAYRECFAGGRIWTYSQIWAAARSLANEVERRFAPADVAMLLAPVGGAFAAAFLGALAAGIAIFPVSCDAPAHERRALAARAGAKFLIEVSEPTRAETKDGFPSSIDLRNLPGLGEEAGADRKPLAGGRSATAALLLSSSGTTGLPKIARRSAAALDAVSQNMVEAIGFTESDRVLATMPLCHSYGLEHGLLAPIWAGSAVHLCRGLDMQSLLHELGSGEITILPGVPPIFEMLAELVDADQRAGREISGIRNLRRAYSAGGSLPLAVAQRCAAKHGLRVGQLYGATEIGSITFDDPDDPHFDPASVGLPMAGVEIRIADAADRSKQLPAGFEGEVLVRAPSMLDYYVRECDAPISPDDPQPLVDGFFATGDLGVSDERGRLTLTGRLKLLIDVGGLKVNPLEIERLLMSDPLVGSAVALPMRLSLTICRMRAIVTPRDASRAPDVDALRRLMRERLAAYKVPRVIEIRATLPTSPSGKVLRHLLGDA